MDIYRRILLEGKNRLTLLAAMTKKYPQHAAQLTQGGAALSTGTVSFPPFNQPEEILVIAASTSSKKVISYLALTYSDIFCEAFLQGKLSEDIIANNKTP